MTAQQIDIAIVGGGMNGATLALALADSGLSVAMIETYDLDADRRPSYDDRGIALAHGTVRILRNLGVWQYLEAQAAPINKIHISDRGHFGFARLDSEEENVDALGYVATANAIGSAFSNGLKAAGNLQLLCPATLDHFNIAPDRVHLKLSRGGETLQIDTRLLVASDGAESPIRKQLAIPVREWEYGHHAIIANVTPGRDHNGVAYERFTDTGPLAVLPLPEGHCAVVWTALDEQVEEIMDLDDAAFTDRLQQRFGYRLGKFSKVGTRAAYPLKMRQVLEHYRQRTVLIGNAAHTVHPIAGQGFNLGIRDVAALAEIVAEAHANGEDVGSDAVLKAYADNRNDDQNTVTHATDIMARLFANPLPPLKMGRNLGLLAVDLLPAAKHLIARQAMGLRGRLPRLAR